MLLEGFCLEAVLLASMFLMTVLSFFQMAAAVSNSDKQACWINCSKI